MNFAVLIESYGEKAVLALGGLIIGALFGFFAQRSRFCLRAATLEFWHRSYGASSARWHPGALARDHQRLVDGGWGRGARPAGADPRRPRGRTRFWPDMAGSGTLFFRAQRLGILEMGGWHWRRAGRPSGGRSRRDPGAACHGACARGALSRADFRYLPLM